MLRLLRKLWQGNRPYVLSLILLNALFFSDVLFTDATYFYRDIGNFVEPLRRLVTEAYARGDWPLWNPYFQFGQPLLANPNAMALYPTQLFFFLLPFGPAFDVSLVVHCLIAGIGAFYLARALGFTPIAALAAGISYNFSGLVLSFVNLPLLAGTASLLPWLAFAFWKVVHRPSWVTMAAFSLAIGLFLLVVEPVTFLASLLFLLPLAIYMWVTRPAGGLSSRLIVGALLIALVSGFCLAAVQLLPTRELVASSGRNYAFSFAEVSFWSVHPVSLTQMLFPGVWADPFNLSTLYASWTDPFYGQREAYIVSCYWGLSCLVFTLVGLFFSNKTGLKWMLTGVGLVALLLALGKYFPLYSFLYEHLPWFQFGRFPAKYLLASTLCFALLTGLGIDQIEQLRSRVSGSSGRRRLIISLLLIGALLAASGLLAVSWVWEQAGARVTDKVIELHYQKSLVTVSLPDVRLSVLYLWVLVLSAAGLVLFAACSRRGRALWITKLAVVLILFDLVTNHQINPVVDSTVYEQSPVTKWLLSRIPQEGLFRVYHLAPERVHYGIKAKSDSLIWHFLFLKLMASPYTAAEDHLQYSAFRPVDGLESVAAQILNKQVEDAKDINARVNVLGRLNTNYLLSLESIQRPGIERQASFRINSNRLLHIYRLKDAYPRAFLVDLQKAKWKRKDEYEVNDPVATPARSGESLRRSSSVKLTSYSPEAVDLDVDAAASSLVVLLDSYYPGWEASVDGRKSRVQLVNRAFRGVVVPAGQHRITFRYRPTSFLYGLTVTLSTILLWMAALAFVFVRRRSKGKAGLSAAVEEERETAAKRLETAVAP